MLRVPVRFAESILRLNRKDHYDLFGTTTTVTEAFARVVNGTMQITVRVKASDTERLDLTPLDADRIGVHPEVISTGRSAEFLRLRLTLHVSGKEVPYRGQLRTVPRRLYVNSIDAHQVSAGNIAAKAHSTVFGNLKVEETSGMSYVQLSREEAVAAMLRENDLVDIVKNSADALARVELPERFLPLGQKKRLVITEKEVWKAIQQRKKIWIPRGSVVTPAAIELGRARGVFEFET